MYLSVSWGAVVTATFSEDMLGTSVSENTVHFSRNGSGWNAPVTISPENPVATKSSLQIAVDPSGVGTAFWVQTPDSDSYIYRKRFD